MKKVNKSIGVNYSDSEDDVVLVDESADVNIDSVYSANESPVKKTSEKKRFVHVIYFWHKIILGTDLM